MITSSEMPPNCLIPLPESVVIVPEIKWISKSGQSSVRFANFVLTKPSPSTAPNDVIGPKNIR